ncbi:MAG: YdiU family protein, partial [Archangium sp.]|nr:YdiU family protein [Archangium sp.]
MAARRGAKIDLLPVIAIGATGEVRRDGRRAIKFAHADPEARKRLKHEAQTHALLERAGFPVPRLLASSPRTLTREWIDGRALTAKLSARIEAQVFALRIRLLDFEATNGLRFDFSPSNLLHTRRGIVLLDGGVRIAAPRFTSRTLSGFRREWRAWFRNPPRARLVPPRLPPSGKFHVETPVGVDRRARLAWLNEPLIKRLGLSHWPRELFLELAHWSTDASPTTTRPSTRYTDGVGMDLERGPRGDGRVIQLGELDTRQGRRHLSAKGIGATPLAWKGRAFHEDGRVSFPRTLWEVTVADELARLGFDTPEYLCVATSSATTVDNTKKKWPAAVGVRIASSAWRLGHLRRFPELASVLRLDSRRALNTFCDNLGHDIGRADALQIHCFNATPGNVRLDGHLIDYSTVRFMRHHLPHFRFLEGAWTINRTRAVWSQQAMLFAELLGASRKRALHRFLRAYHRGVFAGLAQIFGLDPRHFDERFTRLTLELRALRGDDEIRFEFFDQRVPGPRFDLFGKAPELMRALQRNHAAPWKILVRGRAGDDDIELATRWIDALKRLRTTRPARRWNELIRPFLEPEKLASLLYGRTKPRSLEAWKSKIANAALPEGHYTYARARELALERGHLELDTLGGRREVVVGLTQVISVNIARALRRTLGKRLVGVVVHGSRVIDRRELKRREPKLFTEGDLRNRGRDGVREFGPSRECSSDLDLKIFIRGKTNEALERRVSKALQSVGAWFPLGGTPRQRLIPSRHGDVTRAFRAWNGEPRFRELG